MFKKLFGAQQGLLPRFLTSPRRLARLFGAGLLLTGAAARAQTTTVFNETFEGATNSFTLVNGAEPNKWYVGTVAGNGPTTPGTKAAYISNDGGVSHAYTVTATSVTHLYRDVAFPAGQDIAQMSFDWLAGGESIFDYIQVFMVPTTVTPVAGTQLVGGAAGAVQLGGNINLQATFGRTTYRLPPGLAGTTQRLVFTWRNDNSVGTQPPAVVDNIVVTTQTATPFSGVYTINNALPTGGTNFASFTDAANRLNLSGINGPVTLNVLGGPYTEQFLLDQVSGTSATNTIVVNGGGRTLRFASTNSNQRAVVQLNGTDFTTVTNLNIDATGGTGSPGLYGAGVLIANTADNDRITNCTINADVTTTSSNFAGIVVNGSLTTYTASGVNSANNLLLEGNTINGGFYGITLIGNTTAALNTGNVVRNNTVRDFYFYGIYTGYQDGAQFIGNDISRPVRTNPSSFYGLYTFGGSRSQAIEKNKLHDPFTGNLANINAIYAIYLATGTGASATTPNDVVNNTLYNLNGNGLQYLIYNSGANFSRIYNNTISSDDLAATTAAFTYGIFNSGTSVDVKNNVVSLARGGTGIKNGLYYTIATTSNYNDIYVPGGNVGYYLTAYATLANWQTANSNAFDQNSVSADPAFINPSIGNLTPANVLLNNAGTPLARVTEDITGAPRGATPDLGAYEFTPVATDLSPVALLSPATATACYSPTETVTVQVRNNGTAALDYATNTGTVTVVVTPPGSITQTFTTTLTTGTLASGATQNITLPGTLDMTVLGTYSFAVTASVVGDANVSNDVLTPAVTRTVVAPTPGVLSPSATAICVSGTAALSLAGAANGSIQYQSSSSATGPFTNIGGANSAAYTTPVLTSTTYYRVRVTCNSNVATSNVSAITVNNPTISAAPTPLTTCAGGTATLSATVPAGVSVRYYTAATGGTLVGTGSPFVTPVLTANTTYYAEAFTGGQENVGKPSTTGTDGSNTTGGINFTTTGPTVITNVTVYQMANAAAGTATVQLITGNNLNGTAPGPIVTQATVSIPANTTTALQARTLTLSFVVPAAGQYQLFMSASTTSLVRDFSTAPQPVTAFPYNSPSGVVSLTSSSLGVAYYYFFYNWQIGSVCVSATRTPIQVNVTAGLVASLPVAAFTNCGRTPYQLNGTIAGTATGAVYASSGTGAFTPNATTLNATYTPSAADVAAGTVTLTLTPTGPAAPCVATGRVVLTLQTPPNAAFSYPAGTYCTNSPVTVAPVLAPGAVTGTFSASGFGLRIDPVTGVINLATTNLDGTYTVTNTVAGVGACASFASTTSFTVNFGVAQPTLGAASQAGGSVLLSTPSLPGVTYQFFRNGVAVGPPSAGNTLLLTAGAQSGSYTVVATSATGCASVPSTPVSAVITGVQTASRNGVSLSVRPNPTADGRITVELAGVNATASRLSVTNALGQVVHTGMVPAGATALDLGRLATGVYTLRLQTAQGVLTQRLVRE